MSKKQRTERMGVVEGLDRLGRAERRPHLVEGAMYSRLPSQSLSTVEAHDEECEALAVHLEVRHLPPVGVGKRFIFFQGLKSQPVERGVFFDEGSDSTMTFLLSLPKVAATSRLSANTLPSLLWTTGTRAVETVCVRPVQARLVRGLPSLPASAKRASWAIRCTGKSTPAGP